MKKITAFLLAFFIGAVAWGASKTDYQDLRMFNDVLSLIENNYVEEKETSELIDGAITGMIKKLDPFSQFMKPDAAKLMKSETKFRYKNYNTQKMADRHHAYSRNAGVQERNTPR